MPDYKEMYCILFREITKAISILQKAQQCTEELYIADNTADTLILIHSSSLPVEQENKKVPHRIE